MVASILTILAYLLPFVLDGVKRWQEAQEASEADTYANNAQKFDQALAGHDADGMSVLFDRLSAPPGYGGDPGGQDDKNPS